MVTRKDRLKQKARELDLPDYGTIRDLEKRIASYEAIEGTTEPKKEERTEIEFETEPDFDPFENNPSMDETEQKLNHVTNGQSEGPSNQRGMAEESTKEDLETLPTPELSQETKDVITTIAKKTKVKFVGRPYHMEAGKPFTAPSNVVEALRKVGLVE
jgi:hypothetical protein